VVAALVATAACSSPPPPSSSGTPASAGTPAPTRTTPAPAPQPAATAPDLSPAKPVAQRPDLGAIQGHVRLNGPAPANPIIRMGMDPVCAALNAGPRRPVQELVVRGADGGLANAFVTLNGKFPKTAPPKDPVVVRQQKCMYTPRVVGAQVGQALRIVNSDTLVHETHSVTSKGNTFSITQPHSDMVFDYTLKAPEEMLRLQCKVHSWMIAYVGVTTNPYSDVTGKDGAFQIPNVPPGKHEIRVWQERYGWLTKTVDVKRGETATIDFAYTGKEKPAAAELHELIVPNGSSAIRLLALNRYGS
jgi:plastocyanin